MPEFRRFLNLCEPLKRSESPWIAAAAMFNEARPPLPALPEPLIESTKPLVVHWRRLGLAAGTGLLAGVLIEQLTGLSFRGPFSMGAAIFSFPVLVAVTGYHFYLMAKWEAESAQHKRNI